MALFWCLLLVVWYTRTFVTTFISSVWTMRCSAFPRDFNFLVLATLVFCLTRYVTKSTFLGGIIRQFWHFEKVMTNSLGNQEKSFGVPGSNLDCIYEMHENMNTIDYLWGVNFLFCFIKTLHTFFNVFGHIRKDATEISIFKGRWGNLKTDFFSSNKVTKMMTENGN